MLQWADGFDHYGSQADLALNYTATGDGLMTLSNNARTGAYGLRCNFAGLFNERNDNIIRAINPNAIVGVGFAVSCGTLLSSLPTFNGIKGVLGVQFRDTSGQTMLQVNIGARGQLVIYSGGADGYSTLLAETKDAIVQPNVWQYIEVRAICDSVAGVVEIRRNERLVALLTGVNTRGNGLAQYGAISLGRNYQLGIGSNAPYYFDDFVIWDNSGTSNNDFLGPRSLRTMIVTGDGAPLQWSPKTAGASFSQINRVPPDPANHYISSANVGDVSAFGKTIVPENCSDIAAVFAQILARSDTGASVTVNVGINGKEAPLVVTSGVDAYYSGSFQPGLPVDKLNTANVTIKRAA